MKIRTEKEFNEALESGMYAWPGVYPRYFIVQDGEPLSFEALDKENADRVRDAINNPGSDKEWQVVAVEINWEDPDMYCAHTGNRIESAYAEDEHDDFI